jgi:hypothetical protein
VVAEKNFRSGGFVFSRRQGVGNVQGLIFQIPPPGSKHT